MKKVSILAMILIGLILAINHVEAAPPIVVGVNEVRSGPAKSNGDIYLIGIETAVKEINELGGLLGRPIKIVVEDNQMKPQIGLQKLKKLILKDKCEVIFGGGVPGLAIAKTMPRYKKLYVTVSQALDITGKHFNPYAFRTSFNTILNAKATALYMSKQKRLKKPFMINKDYSYGYDVAKLYEKFIKEASPGTVIAGNAFHPLFNKDFAPYISKIQASDADYVLTGNWGMDGSQLILQGRSLGMKLPIVNFLVCDPASLRTMPGSEAVGSIGVETFMPGIGTPETEKFENEFYKRSGGYWPVAQTWLGYQSMMMYASAVEKAGSLDTKKVIKAFEGLEWQGPNGTVIMRAKDHQAIAPMVIGQVVKKTKYFDFPYTKPIDIIPVDQLVYKPEEFGWKPYKEK